LIQPTLVFEIDPFLVQATTEASLDPKKILHGGISVKYAQSPAQRYVAGRA